MITTAIAYKILNQLQNITIKEHFGSDAFCANNRMFATVWKDKKEVNVRLRPYEQRKFLMIDGEGFVAINNAWGKQGWTKIQLEFVEEADFTAAILSAYDQSKVPSKKVKRIKLRKKKK